MDNALRISVGHLGDTSW